MKLADRLFWLRDVAERLRHCRADQFNMNSTHLRRIINAAIGDLNHKTTDCKENVSIREGYVGNLQFPCEGVRAIWLAEEEYVPKLNGDA